MGRRSHVREGVAQRVSEQRSRFVDLGFKNIDRLDAEGLAWCVRHSSFGVQNGRLEVSGMLWAVTDV